MQSFLSYVRMFLLRTVYFVENFKPVVEVYKVFAKVLNTPLDGWD